MIETCDVSKTLLLWYMYYICMYSMYIVELKLEIADECLVFWFSWTYLQLLSTFIDQVENVLAQSHGFDQTNRNIFTIFFILILNIHSSSRTVIIIINSNSNSNNICLSWTRNMVRQWANWHFEGVGWPSPISPAPSVLSQCPRIIIEEGWRAH